MRFSKILLIVFAIIGAITCVFAIIGGTLAYIKYSQIGTIIETFSGPPPPVSVNVGLPVPSSWEERINVIGTVTSSEGISVRPEAPGIIKAIHFTAGSRVEAGELLIDLSKDTEEANLAQARANLDLAQKTLRRSEELFRSRSIAQAELDNARAQATAAEAAVLSMQSLVDQLSIRAPFAGRLGVRQVSIGQYLNPGDAIVVLQAVDPVFIEFTVPQRELGKLAMGYTVNATVDAYPDQVFEGTITAINPQVDPRTRNVLVQATFKNPDERLFPGMFATVTVTLPLKREVIIVPIIAIHYSPTGNRVYLAEETADGQLVAKQTLVRLGESRGDFVEILDGLKGDERIVIDGAFKLMDGMSIQPSDRGTVEAELEPDPENT